MNTIIWATNIKIKKDRVSLILQSSAKINPRKISFTYQNATCSYSWPAAFSLTQKKGTEIHAQIPIDVYKRQAAYIQNHCNRLRLQPAYLESLP